MSLYAIGDLHLSFKADKPMDIFGKAWDNHFEKIKSGFLNHINENDITVIVGDISWAMSLEDSAEDFKFIDNLPGKKIIIKGNHDYWWDTVTKIKKFFNLNEIKTIDILHNNCFLYKDTAICGTRGWFFEEDQNGTHNEKIYLRELGRLEASLKAAKLENAKEICAFLHYPPIYEGYECKEIIELLSKYDVKTLCYGHLHGYSHNLAKQGEHFGINFKLVSGDYTGFVPTFVID